MRYAYSVVVIVLILLSFIIDSYFNLSIILFVATLFMMLDRLGKGIVLRELIALHGQFICLVIPILGYTIFTRDNHLAKLWVRYMPVSREEYYGYALPAMSLFTLALCWPIDSKLGSDQGNLLKASLEKAKGKLQKIPNVSIYIIIIGIVMSVVSSLLPVALQFFATLFFWGSFAGVLYLYYTPHFKYKKLLLALFAFFIFANALRTGMFTILAYMGIALFSYLFLGRKIAFWKKLFVFIVSIFMAMLVQNVKVTFRQYVWNKEYQGSKVALFGKLMADQLASDNSFTSPKVLFPLYYRANQGFNVSLVIRRFPAQVPFDNGSNLFRAIASSFVPRFLWPDKPEAGGRSNMKYYTGITILTWSTNVGPLGEGYGSFGRTGGIIFMFFLGAFIRWTYKRMFIISLKMPLLIFWIPVVFYQVTYSAESDTLQIFNSLVKAAFFVWLLVKILPKWFGIIRSRNKPQCTKPDDIQPAAIAN